MSPARCSVCESTLFFFRGRLVCVGCLSAQQRRRRERRKQVFFCVTAVIVGILVGWCS